jgi:hypothetical protein
MRKVILLLGCLAVTATAAEPEVTAPISAADAREICKIVRSVSKAPIVGIQGDLTKRQVPGAFVRNVYFTDNGHPVWTYERADLVWEMTELTPQAWMMFKLRKSARGWKIIEKRYVEDRP